ncbi:MAG: translation initiation factor IF-2 N-terminal domain-containing protein, partial [Bacillota bacterium]|nr:translation initiation factor IF-2 N-terminal domain-containing protein [Bacillota bacterium]
MPKVRVYELAKELNVRNQDLLTLLQRLGVDAKNHMSVIDEGLAQQIIQRVEAARRKTAQSPAAAPVPAPAAAAAKPAKPPEAPTPPPATKAAGPTAPAAPAAKAP